MPDLNQLLNLVDWMKQVGDVGNVFISKHGDLSVQVLTTLFLTPVLVKLQQSSILLCVSSFLITLEIQLRKCQVD